MASRSAVMISGERSANWASSFLRKAGASSAASRIMAECRSRSCNGEKEGGEDEGASIAIRTASPFASASSATFVAALSYIGSLGRGSGIELEGSLTQSLRSRAQDNLPKRQQDYRYDERCDIIEDAEQQHARQQVLPVHLPQADQHGGIEHPKAAGGVAGEAQ